MLSQVPKKVKKMSVKTGLNGSLNRLTLEPLMTFVIDMEISDFKRFK